VVHGDFAHVPEVLGMGLRRWRVSFSGCNNFRRAAGNSLQSLFSWLEEHLQPPIEASSSRSVFFVHLHHILDVHFQRHARIRIAVLDAYNPDDNDPLDTSASHESDDFE
jgi:hypothetical protein